MTAPLAAVEAVRLRLLDADPEASVLRAAEESAVGSAILAAVEEYSRDRPLESVVELTGNGTKYFELSTANFPGWTQDWSRVVRIEYPAEPVSATYTPQYLDPGGDWTQEYRDATKRYLYLVGHTPTTSEKLRITYTVPRELTTTTNTVVPRDLEAVYDLAASALCLMLATKHSSDRDSALRSDSVNHRDSQMRFKQQAEAWRQRYERHMGKDRDSATGAAAVVTDLDATPYRDSRSAESGYFTRRSYLTHRRRR